MQDIDIDTLDFIAPVDEDVEAEELAEIEAIELECK